MRRSLTTLATLALLFWSRTASAQSFCEAGETRAEVVIESARSGLLCGGPAGGFEEVIRVRVRQVFSGSQLGPMVAAVLWCPGREIAVGHVVEMCFGAPARPAQVDRVDSLRNDQSPRVHARMLRRIRPRRE
jgi:hypothetical protein